MAPPITPDEALHSWQQFANDPRSIFSVADRQRPVADLAKLFCIFQEARAGAHDLTGVVDAARVELLLHELFKMAPSHAVANCERVAAEAWR